LITLKEDNQRGLKMESVILKYFLDNMPPGALGFILAVIVAFILNKLEWVPLQIRWGSVNNRKNPAYVTTDILDARCNKRQSELDQNLSTKFDRIFKSLDAVEKDIQQIRVDLVDRISHIEGQLKHRRVS
jgi:hypothetical protein